MSELQIKSVTKRFGSVPVLHGIDLTIQQGEFFTLLGPSGCGKTTLLRVLAGFLSPDDGSVMLGGQRLDLRPAHERDIGMVFQDYAVFPHLTVAENIGFGLKARDMPQSEIRTRVVEAMQMVQLDGLGDRLPLALSGGQQQRVGLARAIAIRPQLLLMDEPLSNLDAKLRTELRDEIRDLQKRLGITTLYVTHDQEEALAVSDRICVMNKGRIEQTADPMTLYTRPQTRFAAAFVGTMNFITGQKESGEMRFAGAHFALSPSVDALCADGMIEIAIRPEHIKLAANAPAPAEGPVLRAKVKQAVYLGREAQIKITIGDLDLLMQIGAPARGHLPQAGDEITVHLPAENMVLCLGNGTIVPLVPA